jgi:hypothetical protein
LAILKGISYEVYWYLSTELLPSEEASEHHLFPEVESSTSRVHQLIVKGVLMLEVYILMHGRRFLIMFPKPLSRFPFLEQVQSLFPFVST